MKRWFVRLLFVWVLCTAAVIATGLLSPTRGVQRRWEALTSACESHDQDKLNTLLADDYGDAWGLTKSDFVKLANGVFRQFLVAGISRDQPVLTLADDGTATTSAVIRVQGQGSPLAEAVVNGTAQLNTPTVFHWRRMSWKPWDWRLTRVENSGLKQDLKRLEKGVANPGSLLDMAP